MKRRIGPIGSVVVVVILLSVYLAGGLYTVRTEEQALVLRFGEVKSKPVQPGLHWRLPRPFERVVIEPIQTTKSTSAGFRMIDWVRGQPPLPFETEWLTADRNLVEIEMPVKYHISDQYAFDFRSADDKRVLIRWAVEAALTETAATWVVDDVFAYKGELADTVKQSAQVLLDRYQAGVRLTSVVPRNVEAPTVVWAKFDEANTERTRVEELRRKAFQFRDSEMQKAHSDSLRLRNQAQAEAQAIVNEASGAHESFLSLDKQYQRDPLGTRKRLFQESLREFLPKVRLIQAAEKGGLRVYLEK